MINELQRILYKLSCVSPILIFAGFSVMIQEGRTIVCSLIIILGGLLCAYSVLFIKICEKNYRL
jgi:hypothetical protein